MDISESYRPLAQAAHGTATGLFDDSLYGRELAATQPVWDIRSEMDPLRREYLPQFEEAEMAMTDPQRYAAYQQLALDRAEALRDPETAALRLEGADPAYLQGIQDLREKQAAAGATAAQMGGTGNNSWLWANNFSCFLKESAAPPVTTSLVSSEH